MTNINAKDIINTLNKNITDNVLMLANSVSFMTAELNGDGSDMAITVIIHVNNDDFKSKFDYIETYSDDTDEPWSHVDNGMFSDDDSIDYLNKDMSDNAKVDFKTTDKLTDDEGDIIDWLFGLNMYLTDMTIIFTTK